MAIITSASDLKDIRQLVFNDLTTEDLSDTSIQSDIYLGMAERTILTRANTTESAVSSLSAAEQQKIKTAIKYQTAVLILPALPQLLRETVVGITHQYDQISQETKIRRYESIIDTQVPKSGSTGSAGTSRFGFAGVLRGR